MSDLIQSEPSMSYMVLDIITHVLRMEGDLTRAADQITDELRELTGARLVFMTSQREPGDPTSSRILGLNPARRREEVTPLALSQLEAACLPLSRVTLWDADEEPGPVPDVLREMESALTIVIPLLATGRRVGTLFLLGLPDRSRIDSVFVTLEPLRDALALVLCNALLIDEQDRRIEERTDELMQSEARSQALVQAIPDVLFRFDREHRFIDYHTCAPELLFVPPEQFLGKPVEDVGFPGEVLSKLVVVLDQALAGEDLQTLEYSLPGPDAKKYYEGRFVRCAKDEVLAIIRDVTERRSLEDRLRQSEKLQAIGQLAGGIAHDFNNQLAGVMGYADILANRLDEGNLKRYARNILTSAGRAADLTAQLLTFSRKGQYRSIPVDLHSIIDEVADMLTRSVDRRIEIKKQLGADPSVVEGDPSQLQNALLNLGLNGRDAMPDGGELIYATEGIMVDEAFCRRHPSDLMPGPHIVISVTDAGEGMPPEVRKRIFEPFFTTKEQGKGTGMGLAAVYGTVQVHHGLIMVDSEPGHGTTFKLYLPQVALERGEDAAVEGPLPVLAPACIMVVDDEEVIRFAAEEILADQGHEVIPCADGQAAVEVFSKRWQEIDLVILDMIMPRMGGRDCYRAMREINPDVCVILSSGHSINGEAQALLAEGVKGFVQKPYRNRALLEAIAEHLGRA